MLTREFQNSGQGLKDSTNENKKSIKDHYRHQKGDERGGNNHHRNPRQTTGGLHYHKRRRLRKHTRKRTRLETIEGGGEKGGRSRKKFPGKAWGTAARSQKLKKENRRKGASTGQIMGGREGSWPGNKKEKRPFEGEKKHECPEGKKPPHRGRNNGAINELGEGKWQTKRTKRRRIGLKTIRSSYLGTWRVVKK